MTANLKYAVRRLAHQPGFTAVVVLTLALGIGANTAIFSVVRAVLLRPLPYPSPERLVTVWETNPGEGWSERNIVSDGNYVDWRDRNSVFAALGAYGQTFGLGALGDDTPVEVTSTRVTPSVFRVLGAGAQLGRVFTSDEGVPGGEAVVLLSHSVWRDRFGADPEIIGRTVELEEQPFTVVGVMPATFDFPSPAIDVWLPLRLGASARASRDAHKWRVIGRLNPGVTIERSQAEMDAIAAQLRDEFPQAMAGWGVRVVPFRADLVRTARPLLLVLLGVVGTVLLIACANVANLFLASAIGRSREFAVRGALGGTRWRLARQLLVEAGVLAALGVGGGIVLGAWGVEVLVSLAPSDIPLLDHARIDGGVLAYAALAGLASTLLVGVVPAWRAARPELETSLQAGRDPAGSRRHTHLRTALLVCELALSLVLLIGAGLLVRSFLELQHVDHGFEPEGVLAVGIDLPYSRYDGTPDHDAFYGRAIEALEAVPGVVSAAGTAEPPVIGFYNTFSFVIEGRVATQPGAEEGPVPLRPVTPGFFATMGIPLQDGRLPNAFDRADAPRVLAVNETFAQRYWPRERAVGKRISFDEHEGPWYEIVGVVGDTRHFGLDQPVEPAIYMPYAQKRWGWMSWMTFMIRAQGDPLDLVPAIRRAIWSLDDRLPIRELALVEDLYAESNARRRFAAILVVTFAGIAVTLALLGVYGVVSYTVAQRRRELGVRKALGAEERRIVLGVLGQGLFVAAGGVAAGLVGAVVLTRLMTSLLFGVRATDPPTFAFTAALLVAVSLAACWIPARHAARVDPMEALRHE